jgi:four helix bundle protein
MAFIALDHAVSLVTNLDSIENAVRSRRKSLANEIARAADSIALNLGEGRHRRGGDRVHAFRVAYGSAGELTTALRIALGRKLISAAQFGAAEATLDQLRAILWRLTR